MTDEQRIQIRAMREQGHGYTAVAAAAGLSKGSVKAYCRTHGLAGVRAEKGDTDAQPTPGFCAACGKPLVQTQGRKRRRFCCDECRVRWWNSHLGQVKKKAFYSFTCAHCGKEFTAYGNAHRKYCSRACCLKARFGDGKHGQRDV